MRLKELGELEDKLQPDSQPKHGKGDKKEGRDGDALDGQAALSHRLQEQQLEDKVKNGQEASENPWLASHIRVKIIDKRKAHGK